MSNYYVKVFTDDSNVKEWEDLTPDEIHHIEFKGKRYDEVRHGMWKGINKNKYNDDEATCSICGLTFVSGYSDPAWWDYCPNCGSRMDGDTE